MSVKAIIKYLASIESAFGEIDSGYIEKYKEEILTPEKCNLCIRVRFSNGSLLEWNEAVVYDNDLLIHLGFRYHFQDKENSLIFRYDNTPHYPGLKTFPSHKHCTDKVVSSGRPSVLDILEEIEDINN